MQVGFAELWHPSRSLASVRKFATSQNEIRAMLVSPSICSIHSSDILDMQSGNLVCSGVAISPTRITISPSYHVSRKGFQTQFDKEATEMLFVLRPLWVSQG